MATRPETQTDWIEWKGGECPVEPSTQIKVQYADEDRETAERCSTVRADRFLVDRPWHGGPRVIAYRVVSA